MLRWTSCSALRLLKHSQCMISSAPTPAIVDKVKEDNHKVEVTQPVEFSPTSQKSKLVTAAFSSLSQQKNIDSIEKAIKEAKTPEAILAVAEMPNISRLHAYKIVSKLTEWSSKESGSYDYETDLRFLSLCQQLGQSSNKGLNKESEHSTDLTMVRGVTSEDEAARLVATISLQQMLKVLSSLAAKKRRSTTLLRSLAFNLSSSNTNLDVKQGADVLYALASLNFPDEALIEKTTKDLCGCVLSCQKTAVIGSISTSLGILKYKNTELLDVLCDWVIQNKDICRGQDIASLLFTLATVNFTPSSGDKFFQVALSFLSEEVVPSSVTWLEVIWSLVVLNQVQPHHFKSVLSSEFLDRLASIHGGSISLSCKRRLLNINGAAKWTKGYNGPLLGESHGLSNLPLGRTKEKQALVSTVLETLSNLLPSAVYLITNVDTGMGFLMDGECLIDSKMTPLPLIDKKTGEPILHKPQKGSKIAVLVWDYHDFTRGKSELCGPSVLNTTLISRAGYKVLSVPYTEFNPKEKLVTRVQYLEKKLKLLVRPGG